MYNCDCGQHHFFTERDSLASMVYTLPIHSRDSLGLCGVVLNHSQHCRDVACVVSTRVCSDAGPSTARYNLNVAGLQKFLLLNVVCARFLCQSFNLLLSQYIYMYIHICISIFFPFLFYLSTSSPSSKRQVLCVAHKHCRYAIHCVRLRGRS